MDDTHVDFIDFDKLEVVRYTKEENHEITPLDTPVKTKIVLPYIQTYTEDTTINIKTKVEPSKVEFKYFKSE